MRPAVLCDLDGVVYRGRTVLPGAIDALSRLAASETDTYFITNNSTRTPEEGADKIRSLTGIDVDSSHVLTSSLAAVDVLGPDDGPVLVVGEAGVRDAVARAGLEETGNALAAGAVLVGLTRQLTYDLLASAVTAIRNGARFIATNNDTTFPTSNGLAPGAGAIVAAIAAASNARPEVAGKPHRAMRDLIRSRGVREAWVVGDRIDTDIAIARDEPDWRSILVLTGVTDSVAAEASDADHVVPDLSAAVSLVLSRVQQS